MSKRWLVLLGVGVGLSTGCSAQPSPVRGGFYGLRPDAYGLGRPLPRPRLAERLRSPTDSGAGRAEPLTPPPTVPDGATDAMAEVDSSYWVRRIAALPHHDVLLLFPYLLGRATRVAFHVPMMPPTVAALPHRFSSAFGWRRHPVLGGRRWHAGIDIAGPPQPVKATAFGTVVAVRQEAGYGLYIRLDHGNSYETLYGHLSDVRVREGQRVRPGEVMALSGRSGRATGYHLHYEIRKGGQAIDPAHYLTAMLRFIARYGPGSTDDRPAGRRGSD